MRRQQHPLEEDLGPLAALGLIEVHGRESRS